MLAENAPVEDFQLGVSFPNELKKLYSL